MAQLIPQNEPFSAGSEATVAGEVERLAGRRLTRAEGETVSALVDGRSVWADGLRPESLAHIALGLAAAQHLKVLFVSPSSDLLEHRQLRLGRRGPCLFARDAVKQTVGSQGFVIWATPDSLDSALLGRLFGAQGPNLIVVEEAESCTSDSVSYRASWSRLGSLIKRWHRSSLLISAHSSSSELRKKVSATLHAQQFSTNDLATNTTATQRGDAIGIWEFTYLPSSQQATGDVQLRVERDEGQPVAELIGPLPRPALVLCSTPAQADQVFAELEEEQIPVHRFHSGLSAAERSRELVHFALPGRRAVMVTVSAFGPSNGFAGSQHGDLPEAFGRGYAREDLRSIVHLCAPCSLSQYAQELTLLAPPLPMIETPRLSLSSDNGNDSDDGDDDGAGSRRRGEHQSSGDLEQRQKVALMLFNPAHLALNHALLERKRPAPESLGAVVDQFLSHAGDSWIEEKVLAQATGGSARDTNVCLRFLEDAGAVQRQGTQVRTGLDIVGLRQVAEQLGNALLSLIEGDGPRLQEVERYAESTECRAKTLSQMFGRQADGQTETCGHCDICAPDRLMASNAISDGFRVDDTDSVGQESTDQSEFSVEESSFETAGGNVPRAIPRASASKAAAKTARKSAARRSKKESPDASATLAPVARRRASH